MGFKIHLRFIQIAINSVTIVLGITSCIAQGSVSSYFESQCVLNARLSLGLTKNATVTIKATDTEWGDTGTCNFTTFTAAVGAIHAFVWCWFFLLMRGSLKEDGKEMSILLPTAILHFVMFIVLFIACIMLTSGTASFCQNLESALKNKFTCSQAEELPWKLVGGRHQFYTDLLIAKISLWLMLISVLLQCITTGYGIFKILKPPTEESDTESIHKTKISNDNYASSYSLPEQDDVSGSLVFMSSSESLNREGSSVEKPKKTNKGQRKQKKSKTKEEVSEVDVYAEPDLSKKLVDV